MSHSTIHSSALSAIHRTIHRSSLSTIHSSALSTIHSTIHSTSHRTVHSTIHSTGRSRLSDLIVLVAAGVGCDDAGENVNLSMADFLDYCKTTSDTNPMYLFQHLGE